MLIKVLLVIVMITVLAGSVAEAAAQYTTTSEEMKISINLEIEAPRPYFDFDGKTLSWRDVAENESHYLRVTVSSITGGAVSGATVKAAVLSLKDKVIGTSTTLHETWDADRPHYGTNIQLEDAQSSGIVAVQISPGKGRRLGKVEGDFFTKPVTVRFDGVDFRKAKAAAVALKNHGEETTESTRVEWPKGRRQYVAPTPYPGAERPTR